MNDFDPTDQDGGALLGARKRRFALLEAIGEVEAAVSAPSGNPSWYSALEVRLLGLSMALEHHVEEVEGPDGLLAELMMEAPRLANQIKRVEGEHPVLAEQVEACIQLVDGEADPEVVRATVLDTLGAFSRHRQSGADLVYEAYKVDIGGG